MADRAFDDGALTGRGGELGEIARAYVHLALAVGEHDAAYVDAYYGPAAWRDDVRAQQWSLSAIAERADALLASMPAAQGPDGPHSGRAAFLTVLISALRAHVGILSGSRLAFDAEAKALYDIVPLRCPESHVDGVHAELERLLPGAESLPVRLEQFRQRFELPRARLADVFHAAIEECRRRTAAHIELPTGEAFVLEFVQDKPWSGYNWYAGRYRSCIQVNTDLPVHLDRVIDLAAHEGYPGHHVFNTLIEARLVGERGWEELTVFPLFSPLALLAEGTANFGIDVAFPGGERIGFEREVLAPMAGVPAEDVERYHEMLALVNRLSYAANDVARQYLDGAIDRDAAIEQLVRRVLMTRERAAQRTRFFDAYRSYVVNYNVGLDLVRAYVERKGGVTTAPDRRWEEYLRLLLDPLPPSSLL
ncbi:MAG: hypothetical protein AB7Q29_18965 [Vicinamibacterales bacterium]